MPVQRTGSPRRPRRRYQQSPTTSTTTPGGGPLSGTPPPVGGSGTAGSGGPIGVPEGFYAPFPGLDPMTLGGTSPDSAYRRSQRGGRAPGQTQRGVPPRYFDGDEYRPASWSAERIFNLQLDMARAGVLRGNFVRGYWDETTRNAYRDLLGYSNGRGYNWERSMRELLALSDSVAAEGGQVLYEVDEYGNVVPVTPGGSGGGQARPALVTQITDPDTLRRVFRRAVIDIAGEGWDQNRINQMVEAYNQLEIDRQRSMYEAEEKSIGSPNELGEQTHAPEPGMVTDIPTPESFIESQVNEKEPWKVQEHEALTMINEFMGTLAAPAWGVGQTGSPL